MTTAIDELKTLIALAGNKRLPYLEVEIFADSELTKLYLHNLCKEYHWYSASNPIIQLAFRYVCAVNLGRWSAAELLFAQDPQFAYLYARQCFNGRWIEAESVIALDAHFAYYYARDYIKCRWPAAETSIAKSPIYACLYATTVLFKRWYTAEPVIAADNFYWSHYCDYFAIT